MISSICLIRCESIIDHDDRSEFIIQMFLPAPKTINLFEPAYRPL